MCAAIVAIAIFSNRSKPEVVSVPNQNTAAPAAEPVAEEVAEEVQVPQEELHPMAIESLRNRTYEGGQFAVERELAKGNGYRQYIASYKSEGVYN